MGSVCSRSTTNEASIAIASSVIDPVVGQVVNESYQNVNGAHLHIRDIVLWCTHTPDGYATYTIRHGKKVVSFQSQNSAAQAIIAEVRACFVDTPIAIETSHSVTAKFSSATTFYVTCGNGFNIGHFKLFKDIHPTDICAHEILTNILREMPDAGEYA
jgi:hypothetical protein